MIFQEGIDENLRFLILEVRKQIERTREYLEHPSRRLVDSVRARDDYIDHLKSILQRKCFSLAAKIPSGDRRAVDMLRAINVITSNLERIADFCESVIGQIDHLESHEVLRDLDPNAFFREVLRGVGQIERAVFERDVQVALEICRCEQSLDELYAAAFRHVLAEMHGGENVQSLVTALFIAHYFERMGDSLLNIGESIISSVLGEQIKIDQFRVLRESMDSLRGETSVSDVSLEALGETRSGCRIDRVSDQAGDEERMVIFKEGRIEKLLEEKESVDRWNELMPGVAPEVYSFHRQGESGAMLLEYLPGRTFEEILLQGKAGELDDALASLSRVLADVWQKTRREEPVQPRFVSQLGARAEEVYAVHPRFRSLGGWIGSVEIPRFEALLERAQELDAVIAAPFSVLIHGDFNVDNVIVTPEDGRVRFIDLHRSEMMDYVQDVSVFLVSNYRLQVFEAPVRRRINQVIIRFYEFVRAFAREVDDATFEARLALGLARSLASSTRFVLDESFAKSMFLRARYLIEIVLGWDRERLSEFRLPREVLID